MSMADTIARFRSLPEGQRIDYYVMQNYDPVDYLRAEMEIWGWRPVDLSEQLGSRAKVADVLARRRGLSVAMIRRLVFDKGLSPFMLLRRPRSIESKEGQSDG